MNELDSGSSIETLLRGTLDTDRAKYYHQRFAQMLTGEPTWIAQPAAHDDEEIYSYYIGGNRLGYLQTETDSVKGFTIIDGIGEELAEFPDLQTAVLSFHSLVRVSKH